MKTTLTTMFLIALVFVSIAKESCNGGGNGGTGTGSGGTGGVVQG